MLKIMKDCWYRNSDKLRAELKAKFSTVDRWDFDCNYEDLVKLTFGTIYNSDSDALNELDLEKITSIDNGDYQGTIVFVIPFNTYQPSCYEYLMTYIGYGSCSYCDALQHACDVEEGDERIASLMSICKCLINDTIKPYNHGWMHDDNFDFVEEEVEA